VSLYGGLRWWIALQNGDHVTILQILSEERSKDSLLFNYSNYLSECQAIVNDLESDGKSTLHTEISLKAIASEVLRSISTGTLQKQVKIPFYSHIRVFEFRVFI
jgi:hypothetical protein